MSRTIAERLSVIASALSADPRQSPRLARQIGFRGLLFDVWSSGLDIPELSGTGKREFRQVLAADNQALVGLRMEIGSKGFSPGADIDRNIDRINQALESAAALQAPLVCIDLGRLPQPAVAAKPKPRISSQQAGLILVPAPTEEAPVESSPARPPDPAFASQVQSVLSHIGSSADRFGVTIAFSSSLASFAALHQSMLSANCPWFGIDLDPTAILRDEWSRDEIFSTLGNLIRHVRARDAVAGADRRTRPAIVGSGDTNWAELLTALDEAGYAGFITIDPLELPDRSGGAAAGLKHLQDEKQRG